MNLPIQISKHPFRLVKKYFPVFFFLLGLSFLSHKINAQEREPPEIDKGSAHSISVELTFFEGYLSDLDYEISPNYILRLYKSQNFELQSKVGFGLRMLFVEHRLLNAHFYLEGLFGKEKHFFITGLGIMKLNDMFYGTHIPLVLGYKYNSGKKSSLTFQINPVLWFTNMSFDGYNTTERLTEFIFEDGIFSDFWIKVGWNYHF